ncbi:MAG: phosphoenolpyruvate synthase [Allosphingosinicella sp.]
MVNLLWFREIGIADVAVVGGKNASLGEMTQALASSGVRVPDGFATTADAYRAFLRENDLVRPIGALIDRYHRGEITLSDAGGSIRSLLLGGFLSESLTSDLRAAYDRLARSAGTREPSVAVRSSATAEDLAGASFAGQQETYLNVRGKKALVEACRRCFASLFTDRAISYRELKGFGHLDVALSVGVQRMVRSDLGGSGVMFTIDTETGFPNVAVISAAWGLGETVVQGMVDPDQYMVFKPLLDTDRAVPIIEKRIGGKACKMVYGRGPGRRTRLLKTPLDERGRFVLEDEEVLQLARWGAGIERHYGKPMDIEWAKDGETGELFILQARPETVQAGRSASSFDMYKLKAPGSPLVTGRAIGTAISTGKACVVRSPADLERFQDGQIVVAEVTNPDWLPLLKRAAGVVTDHGGTTSHAAIVSRELGLPAIVGTGNGTAAIVDGQEVTLSCAAGEQGAVYEGILPFSREAVDVAALPPTRTSVMVNLANPDAAFQWWRLPAQGVGLARMEFIISALIKAHPMALAHPERLGPRDAAKVRKLTAGHANPADYFVDLLARGIGKLAAPYYPNPAIVRLSDFKTNEYASLIGGSVFEPAEENPMLGFRGASRYYNPRYRDGFALECRALKRVREELGFTNVIVMVPFCRTPEEADRVLAVMAENGLRRGEAGLQIYMMCEIPSNVILAEEFAKRFDGFSIGSNDLTQLVLGVDRDSDLLAELFDERSPAVTRMIAEVIAKARAAKVKVGICGQAPSNYPDFAAFLVREGIDSISLNPDSFVRTVGHIAAAESEVRDGSQRAA